MSYDPNATPVLHPAQVPQFASILGPWDPRDPRFWFGYKPSASNPLTGSAWWTNPVDAGNVGAFAIGLILILVGTWALLNG